VSDSDYRNELIEELSESNDLAVIAASDLQSSTRIDQTISPDFIICEESSYGGGNINSTARDLKRLYPESRIISLLDYEEFELVVECLRNGASGVVVKSGTAREVVDALSELQKGGAPLPRSCARRLVESFQRNLNSPLTSRETEVMSRISQGKSYKVIAHELYVHPETVKTHMKNIYSKLNVRSKADAIEVATREKLI
jgi:DNA-binding NarL/FixJ family response regulator